MAARRGRCSGHALVAAALCCACAAGVAGLDLDEVMAALPAETRARLSKQNAEVRAVAGAIFPYIFPAAPAYLQCICQVTAMTETIFREFDSDRDGQLSHAELQALLRPNPNPNPSPNPNAKPKPTPDPEPNRNIRELQALLRPSPNPNPEPKPKPNPNPNPSPNPNPKLARTLILAPSPQPQP